MTEKLERALKRMAMETSLSEMRGKSRETKPDKTDGLGSNSAAEGGDGRKAEESGPLDFLFTPAKDGFFEGLAILPSSPQQALKDMGYTAERLGAGLLGAVEGVTDLLGTGIGKAVQGITSVGGLFPNAVSEWGGDVAEHFLNTSPTQAWENSIRERYNPSSGAENLSGVGQTIAQMLPAIGVGSAISAGGSALNAAQAASRGANAGRAIMGAQAAGNAASEAYREGADTNQALAYGVTSGLLETTIESIAGGIPGLGRGKIGEISDALMANPIVSRALDIAGEGGEEALSTALTPYLQRAIYDPDAENATAEEIAQSAVLGAVAAGVLQGGLVLPTAISNTVSDVRNVRQAIGSNQDIINRANQRIAQDLQARREAANPLLSRFPSADEVGNGQTGRDNRLVLPSIDSNGAAGYDMYTSNNLTGGADNGRGAEASSRLQGVHGTDVRSQGGRTYAGREGPYTQSPGESQGPADWAIGHLIKTPTMPAESSFSAAKQYAPDVFVVDDATIKSRNQSAWAVTNDGKIYISDSVPEELADVVGYHEAVHALKQRGSRQYDDLVNRIGEQLNYGENVDQILGIILKSRLKGKSVLDLTFDELNTVYDELNAVIWGYHKADPENARAQFSGMFRDYDAYIQELDGIMEGAAAGVSPDSSVGAAPAGFDAYGRLIGKYGAIEPGENPAPHSYAVEVPRQTTANDRVSLSARTIMEAAVTPDAMIPDLAQMVVDGKFSRIPVSNKKSISNAETRILQVGYQNALMSWIQDVKNGNVSEQTMAMGAVLYNNAATAGDGKTALDIAYYFAQAATQGARATQANRILKMLTPSGQLYMVQKMVNDVNDAVYDSRKNRPGNVPVELWMQRVGENLADELSSRLNVKPMEAKTVAQTILSDLRRYANETAPRRPTSRDTRTEMDRIMDLFQNRAVYEEAWQAAKDTLSDTFENNPDALSTFEAWLDSSLEYTRRLTKELTQQDQIVLPEELADRFLKAETNEARDAVLDEINQYIADQIPSTFLEKFNALRYTNMLGNLKTQIRNVGGNAIMRAVRAGRVKVQAALESAAEKSARRKGREFERTTSATRDKEIYRLAMDEFDQAQAQIMGEQKYSYNGRPIPADIQNRRTIFRVNGTWGTSENSPARLLRRAADLGMSGLEGYRRLTNWSMETGDLLFARSAYADALSRYLKANGVTAEQYQNGTADPELMERARSHAVREAQEATFRDKNAFSDAISSIGFRRPKNNIEHAINMAVQGVLPFRRTPANVAVRAVEYSPLGLIGTAAKEFKRLKGNQNITSNDVISSLAKTLTGSGIMAIGGALGYFGLLTGMEGDDEEQNELNQQSGRQDYALYLPEFITDAVGLPKGFNFTLDWASPMSIPLFMGAELGAEVSKNGIQAKDFFDAIASSSNVLLDMSMLQGVNDQLTNISYSENPLVDLALNSLTDYLQSGFTSTFGGQLERSAEDVRMTTYTDENLELPTDVQYTIGSQLARVPGVDYQQIPYIDAWGREESSGTVLPRTFNQFLNPAYTSSDTATPAIEETQRLYDLTGDGGVVSERPEKEITVNGEEIYLNSGQYLQYATERGQERDRLVSSVIQSQAYQGLSAEDQVSVIKDIYSYTDAVTKSHISDYEPDGWIANVVESGVNPADYILYKHSKQDGMTLKERSELMERSGISGADRAALLLTENPDWAEDAREYGLSEQLYVNFKIATSDVTSDKDENGKTVTNSKKEKIMNIIDQMGVDNDTKDALYYAAGYKESTIDDAPWH